MDKDLTKNTCRIYMSGIILILEKIPFPSCYKLPTMLGAGAWKL